MVFTENQQKNLTAIQDIQLKILRELYRICDKYGIKCSLTGGTLLGAMRHKDFIPWDDDIDIDVRCEDYYKLISILPDELGEEFEFVPYDSYGNYFCDFISRIIYKNSRAVTSYSPDGGKHNFANDDRLNHIFIELYCLYDTDDKNVKKQIFKVKTVYGLAMGHRYVPTNSDNYSFVQKLEVAVLSNIGKHIPMKKLCEMYENIVNEFAGGNGNLYFKPSSPLPLIEKNVFDKNIYSGYKYTDIRNDKALIPDGWEDILVHLYKTWRELPPEKDRKPAHFNLDSVEIW